MNRLLAGSLMRGCLARSVGCHLNRITNIRHTSVCRRAEVTANDQVRLYRHSKPTVEIIVQFVDEETFYEKTYTI